MTVSLRDGMFKHCEEIGEPAVRANIASNAYAKDKLPHVLYWLQLKDNTGSGARHKQNLKATEDANDIARQANHIAKWAIGISIISAGIALFAILG